MTLPGFFDRPWRKGMLCFALGALATLSMPPAGAFPVLLLCVPAFAALCRTAATRREAFSYGWAFGGGYFIVGLYWISAALFVDIRQWGWVLPLSALVGPGLFALYYGAIPLLARRYAASPAAHALAFAAAWALVEWLRGHWLTGFPWNLTGYAWSRVLPVMQGAALVGSYGLTLLTLFWATSPVFARRGRVVFAVQVLSFAAVAAFGIFRLSAPAAPDTDRTVRIVQANIPEHLKWHRDEAWNNLQRHIDLSRAQDPADFIVWPETAISADLDAFPRVRSAVAAALPQNSLGIFGALRPVDGGYANGSVVLDTRGGTVATYDKHHLVPFGEYIPFRRFLNLTPIAAGISGIGDFVPGPGPRTLKIGAHPSFSPLICYEVIFPGEVADRKDRPDWLVNVTNDAWYGRTAGPYQHLESARLRAVEEGLPLARAANTGMSALIDPMGRIVARLDLNEADAIDEKLPAPLSPTPYTRLGDLPFWILLAALMLAAEFLKIKDNRTYPT